MMLIEKSTVYTYKIQHLQNPNFDDIRTLAVKFCRELSENEQNELYDMLNRGVDLISNEPQMMMYLHSFGLMHQAKLKYAFEHLPQNFFQEDAIEIIDYGCGQAISEVVYADYLCSHSISQNVIRITLIEPSEICLKRAALHAKSFFPDVEIRTICKTFDRLTDEDIETDENSTKLHILSNVLDIQRFNLQKFANLIDNNTKGYNQFVCVGPYFNYPDKDERMGDFAELLGGNISYSKCFDKYEFVQNKSWTCNVCVFEKGKVSKPETYTDEQGVEYGNYGKLLKYAPKGLTEYTIPDSVTEIGWAAFEGCSRLQSITIPDSVMEIGWYAFSGCRSLQSIIIPDSVTKIGDYAFVDCVGLQSITIPGSVMEIGGYAFSGCSKLQSIEVDINNKNYCADNDVLFNKNKTFLIRCSTKYKEYTIPESVTEIGESAFSGCKSITIPDSVTEIGYGVFSGCSSLQSIKVDGNNQNYCADNDVLFNKDKSTLIRCSTKYKEYTIPDSVTKIGLEAFWGCHNLQSITIPNSVTIIGYKAFESCSSLRSITIPDSVTIIGYKAFSGCSSLQSINIPDSVTEIGYGVFSGCSNLQNIKVSDNVSKNVLRQILKEIDSDIERLNKLKEQLPAVEPKSEVDDLSF